MKEGDANTSIFKLISKDAEKFIDRYLNINHCTIYDAVAAYVVECIRADRINRCISNKIQ